ncbi:MAG: hypothetical protein PHD67_09795 [Oscillospiraceae bacterium]|nr:hypothetical protein [Oscillospiraceae bacterium]
MIVQIIGNPVIFCFLCGALVFAIVWPVNRWATRRTLRIGGIIAAEKANEDAVGACASYATLAETLDGEVIGKILRAAVLQHKIDGADIHPPEDVKAILIKDFLQSHLLGDEERIAAVSRVYDCTTPSWPAYEKQERRGEAILCKFAGPIALLISLAAALCAMLWTLLIAAAQPVGFTYLLDKDMLLLLGGIIAVWTTALELIAHRLLSCRQEKPVCQPQFPLPAERESPFDRIIIQDSKRGE